MVMYNVQYLNLHLILDQLLKNIHNTQIYYIYTYLPIIYDVKVIFVLDTFMRRTCAIDTRKQHFVTHNNNNNNNM